MYRRKKLTELAEFERVKVFKRPVTVYQSNEFIDRITIKDIVHFESKIGGQLVNDVIIVAENTNDRYVLSNCTFYYG